MRNFNDNFDMKITKLLPILTGLLICCCLIGCENNSLTDETTNVSLPCQHGDIISETIAPTCESNGYTVNKCNNCDFSYCSDFIPATGHTYSDTTTSPKCESAGYTEYTCSCGFSYKSDFVSALGHNYIKKETIAPTCSRKGYAVYVCSSCDKSYNSDYTEPIGHIYTINKSVPETCTSYGFTEYTCECGYSYQANFVEPTGHNFVLAERKYATISQRGFSVYKCNLCNYEYTGDYVFYNQISANAYSGSSEPVAYGIDISQYNHTYDNDGNPVSLNWQAIKDEGVQFAILRAYGKNKDEAFELNYNDAKAVGMSVGAYLYTYATTVEEIKAEAYKLLSCLEGKQFEYPIYLDIEDPSLQNIPTYDLMQICITFVELLQSKGYYASIYVNNNWLINYLEPDFILNNFDVWYARYPSNVDIEFIDKESFPTWSVEQYGQHLGMWQFTSNGKLNSIEIHDNQGNRLYTDLNVAFKDYPLIMNVWGLNGHGETPTTEKNYLWVLANLNVRSTPDFDDANNIIGFIKKGDMVEVLEKNENYTVIKYNGSIAYITANTKYISFSDPLEMI